MARRRHTTNRVTPATAFFLLAPLALLPPGPAAAAEKVDLLYLGRDNGDVLLGVQQGLEEANRLGRFTGHVFNVHTTGEPDAVEDVVAVLADTTPRRVIELAAHWHESQVPVLNLSATQDALRRSCLSNLFHLAPSESMRSAAVDQWRRGLSPDDAGASVEATAWHPDFLKFSARELNHRFREARGRPMSAEAWAGWAGVKMIAEAVARTSSVKASELRRYLRHELSFDGVKGVALSFRPTGQLRQPLLIVAAGKLVGEAPVRGVAAVDDLDSLGLLECDE